MTGWSWLTAFSAQPDPVFCTILAVAAALLMGFARSGIGAGGFVVSPLMVLALGPTVGIAVVAALMLPAAATSWWQHRSDAQPHILRPLIPAAFVGTAVGGVILWWLVSSGHLALVHRRLEVVVAGLSLLYVALVMLRKPLAHLAGENFKATPKWLFLVGTGLGLSQTVANSGAPLMTVYFLCCRIGKEQFVGAQATFLLIQNILKFIPLTLLGLLHLGNATAALVLMPLTFFGSWLGQRFYKSATESLFFAVYVILLVIGFVASVLLIIGRQTVLGWL